MTWKSCGLAEWEEGNVVYISVAFSWMAVKAYSMAVFYRELGKSVKIGGPGVFSKNIQSMFEGVAEVGGNYPDAIRRHNPDATIASRGCPVGCSFCIVPAMEGKSFTLLPEFHPRPTLCDNNVSALPVDYQQYIIAKYIASDVNLLDINSGFEPKTFDEETYHRWDTINRGAWRFAYDETKETNDVYRVTRVLEGVSSTRKRVYVLIGNEPFEDCLARIYRVIEWGCEPHVQPVIALNSLEYKPLVRYDWNARKLSDVARWANRWFWRKMRFSEYNPRNEVRK